MHTHATVQAIRRLSGYGVSDAPVRWACDWTRTDPAMVVFYRQHAWKMISGEKMWPGRLPTCPTCLMFIDLALLESGLTCGENVEAL